MLESRLYEHPERRLAVELILLQLQRSRSWYHGSRFETTAFIFGRNSYRDRKMAQENAYLDIQVI
jgi:hypothetical protein